MKKLLLASAIASVTAMPVLADTYQAELEATYAMTSIHYSTISAFGIGGSYYLDEVDTSKGPLAAASFLDRASDVSADLLYADTSFDNSDASSQSVLGADLSTRVVFADSWTVQAGFGYEDNDAFDTVNTVTLGVGKYIAESAEIGLVYSSSDDEADSSVMGFTFHGIAQDDNGQALELEAGVARAESGGDHSTIYSGDLTYYLMKNLGFGAGAEIESTTDADETTVSLHAKYFITPAFSVTGYYASIPEGDGNEGDMIGIAGGFRF